MSRRPDNDSPVKDEAARAGWLYYVAHKTQDEIARILGVSRQRAQRLVSRAVSENLIRVRLEHEISHCMELEQRLIERFGLLVCRIAPSTGDEAHRIVSLASVAAEEMERVLRMEEPQVIALGTGRALRSVIEELTTQECEQHRIVSLIGNIAPDGTASYYDVIMRIADIVRAPHFPMPLPVIAETEQEREVFHALKPVQKVSALARAADISFVGIGQMGKDAPLLKDGFISHREWEELRDAGAAGEIVAWAYDKEGNYLDLGTNRRVTSVQVKASAQHCVVGIAAGAAKVPGLRGALKGNLINGLITDEETAEALLKTA